VGETGRAKDPAVYGTARRALAGAAGAAAETAAKNARNYGGEGYARGGAGETPWHEHFGLVVASCERGDVRPTPKGVMVYGDETRELIPLAKPAVPRAEVIDELCAAVFEGRAPLHDGWWGRATLEVCIAMLRSARERREIALHPMG
jgi:phthalate 4,5-cis-dihydrodiol dehydrogenase